MTQYTPEQARHIAGCMERGAEMRNMGAPALRSLADQVEALTAELAVLLHPKSILADSGVIAAPVAGAHPDKGTSALAAPVVPAPGALDSLWHLKLMMEYSAFGGVLQLEDALANIDDFAATATPPQAAPVAQLSEPPEGWKLVPIEPTEEMVDAACDIDARGIALAANIKRYAEAGLNGGDYVTTGQIFAEEYKAALAAAPATPKELG